MLIGNLANRVIKQINLGRSQAMIFTGVSGSGKTQSASHVLTFLCNSSLCEQTKQRISATNSIFEIFGNATTSLNENSSRFSKLTDVNIKLVR